MRRATDSYAALLLIVSIIAVLLTASCEPYQVITVENQTSLPIKAEIWDVPLDYTGTPYLSYRDSRRKPVSPGESRKYAARVSRDRILGSQWKYVVVCADETTAIVYSRVFAWDELQDMGWRIEVER